MTDTAGTLGGRPLATEQTLGHSIFVFGNIIAGGYYERAERPFGLSLAEWTVLRTVIISPRVSQADVSNACGLNAMNVSRAAAGLQRNGLVDASPDPSNHRRKMLEATELGQEIATDLAASERLLYEHVFSNLSAKDLERLDATLGDLVDRLGENPPPEPPAPSQDWRAKLGQ